MQLSFMTNDTYRVTSTSTDYQSQGALSFLQPVRFCKFNIYLFVYICRLFYNLRDFHGNYFIIVPDEALFDCL